MSDRRLELSRNLIQSLADRAGLKLTDEEMDLVDLNYKPTDLAGLRRIELGEIPPICIYRPS